MDPENTQVPEKKNKETLEQWDKSKGEDFRSADWIRQRYYNKLNIKPPPSL